MGTTHGKRKRVGAAHYARRVAALRLFASVREAAGIGTDGREGNDCDGKCKSVFLHDFSPWLQKVPSAFCKYLREEGYRSANDSQSPIAAFHQYNLFSDF